MNPVELFKSLTMKITFTYSKEKMQIVVSACINKENVFHVVNVTKITEENITADRTISSVEDLV